MNFLEMNFLEMIKIKRKITGDIKNKPPYPTTKDKPGRSNIRVNSKVEAVKIEIAYRINFMSFRKKGSEKMKVEIGNRKN